MYFSKLIPFLLLVILSSCFNSANRNKIGISEQMQALTSLQGEQMERISLLEERLREVYGKLEELEYTYQKGFKKELSNLKSNLVGVERRLPLPEIVPKETLLEDKVFAKETIGKEGVDLESSLNLIQKGEFTEAIYNLSLLVEGSTPEVSMRAIFWQALSSEALYEYSTAINQYNQLITNFEKSPRAAESLFRLVNLFNKMGNNKLAVLTEKKLSKSFPNTIWSKKAKQVL